MKVAVYWNLRKRLFSVKALEGPRKGRVVEHATPLFLRNVTFKINEKVRQRVIARKRKEVHAFAIGELVAAPQAYVDYAIKHGASVTYNPYLQSQFATASGPILEAPALFATRFGNSPQLFAFSTTLQELAHDPAS